MNKNHSSYNDLGVKYTMHYTFPQNSYVGVGVGHVLELKLMGRGYCPVPKSQVPKYKGICSLSQS